MREISLKKAAQITLLPISRLLEIAMRQEIPLSLPVHAKTERNRSISFGQRVTAQQVQTAIKKNKGVVSIFSKLLKKEVQTHFLNIEISARNLNLLRRMAHTEDAVRPLKNKIKELEEKLDKKSHISKRGSKQASIHKEIKTFVIYFFKKHRNTNPQWFRENGKIIHKQFHATLHTKWNLESNTKQFKKCPNPQTISSYIRKNPDDFKNT